ncbi:MAG: hypothetical protein ACK4OO_06795, partial [bacterium]
GGSYFPTWHTSPLAEVDIARFAAETMGMILEKREIPLSSLDYLITGSTIPWLYKFWGSPYLSHLMGHRLPGFHLEQACATGLQTIIKAFAQVESGSHKAVGVLTFDKTSNSPASVFPNQATYRRTEVLSDVWDNFGYDPSLGSSGFNSLKGETSMLACAGRAARKYRLDWHEVSELAYYRYFQYYQAVQDGFHNDYLFPVKVLDMRGNIMGEISQDNGIRRYESAEDIRRERQLDTCVSAGTQTHASDGMFTLVVCDRDQLPQYTTHPEITIQLIGCEEYRTLAGLMPEAPVIAVGRLLQRLTISLDQITTIYDHNPFAVNDTIFAHQLGWDWHNMNDTGCPLVYGHPQGPTLMRVTVEALERVVQKGGGYALIFGCAAGDVGIAALFSVTETGKGG